MKDQHLSGQDEDQTTLLSLSEDMAERSWAAGERRKERFWTDDVWGADDVGPGAARSVDDLASGLTNIGFIKATLRRTARLWCTFGLIGLVAGLGAVMKLPPPHKSATSLILVSPPNLGNGQAIQDDQAFVQSRTLAADALRRLGLQEDPAIFLTHYTSTVVTTGVLGITVSATSADLANREANALAESFLAFQAQLLTSQQQLVDAAFQQQISQAQQGVASISQQISVLSAKPAEPAQQSKVASLKTELSQATKALVTLKQTVATTDAANLASNEAVIKGSRVLDQAAPVKSSAKRRLIEFVGGGLVAGMAIGLGIVLVGALLSGRLRRRDDIARILGASVKLSVGKVRPSRWRPGRRGLQLARNRRVRQIVAYLGAAVTDPPEGPATLAVVAVDDVQVPAVSLVTLALSCAKHGLRVVVADLCQEAPAGRLLGSTEPGVRTVSVQGAALTLVVPDYDDMPPTGPFRESPVPVPAQVTSACASAHLVLTLASLDPALGGEHLTSWATSVVAMVTAGCSSAERIYAVGEMIRLAGPQFVSAVLVGADVTDESLGIAEPPIGPGAAVVASSVQADPGVSSAATEDTAEHLPRPDPKLGSVAERARHHNAQVSRTASAAGLD